MLKWEQVPLAKDSSIAMRKLVVFRARVVGGWLVCSFLDKRKTFQPKALHETASIDSANHTDLAFVPDPKNEWQLPGDE